MTLTRRALLTGTAVSAAAGALTTGFGSPPTAQADVATTGEARAADAALDRALARLVRHLDGPPGAAAIVQRGERAVLHRAGVADVATGAPIRSADAMRMASVAKAYSGAVALSVAADGLLSLDDAIGQWLPGLQRAWSRVTLRDLLQHTSGIPDFSQNQAFIAAVTRSPLEPPPPRALLTYAPNRLDFAPGSAYHYSNSDNIVVGLMVEAATGRSYERLLRERVFEPLGLQNTSLPHGADLPSPFVHGYELAPPKPPVDVTDVIAAGWAWASGGIVATPADANRFIRAYAGGLLTSRRLHEMQFDFWPGESEPPGPGRNWAGLAIFRYRTRCGTVYGHTGNTSGFTQFVAATGSGHRSVVVSINAQITPKSNPHRFVELRRVYRLAVCAALGRC